MAFVLFTPGFGLGQTLDNDRIALEALYSSLDGPNWVSKTGWLVPGSSPCQWFGVGCNAEGTRVTELHLRNNKLTGSLPVQLGQLTGLKYLDLNRNFEDIDGAEVFFTSQISGVIPTEIGNLISLVTLDLGGNVFHGTIPSSIGNLLNLKFLDISYTEWEGGFGSTGGMSGILPSELGNLTQLVTLKISAQNATGSIPSTLGYLKDLEVLDLYGNNFSGSIPSELGKLLKLKYLNLGFNGFRTDPRQKDKYFGGLTGPMPDISELPMTSKISVEYQSLNFEGIEGHVGRFAHYSPQAKLPIKFGSPPDLSVSVGRILFVEAGGTLVNNTYKWFKNNELIVTIVGNKNYSPVEKGSYRVEVTNTLVPGLTLKSEEYEVSALPITVVTFSGKNGGRENTLTWKTTSETNNAGFEIEKSPDAKTFKKIGFIDGNGDSKEVNTYSFTDANPLPITYYRLKQIDFDGKFEYSRIISVKNEALGFAVYPNPAQNQLFVANLEKAEEVLIRNLDGKVFLKQHVDSKVPVNTSNFPSGLYFITIGNETRKILIQK